MEGVVKSLYNAAFGIWNALIEIAMTLFTTSPKQAGGTGPYLISQQIFNAISDATIPIATVFFIIALYKTVVSSPPEQQAQRFLMDALEYCMILFVAANLWTIMGYIIDFSDGITAQISATSGYKLSMGGDLKKIIEECLELPEFELSGEWFSELWSVVGCSLVFMLAGIILIMIMVASCMSILSCAFQRILKPLIILPFAGIAVALGAGGHDISRSMFQYMKTFFGFCISGAVMIISIKVGVRLSLNLVSVNLSGTSDIYKCLMITIQSAITPIVISGLVKGSDSMISRMF